MYLESRGLIKRTVKRLPVFLQGYISQLDKMTEEYRIASEMAEAMDDALTVLSESRMVKEGEN